MTSKRQRKAKLRLHLITISIRSLSIVETRRDGPAFTDVNASLSRPLALTALGALAIRLTGTIVSFLTLGILRSVRLRARKLELHACA